MLGTSETQIWTIEYYLPQWQAWFDIFNSIPLIACAIMICWYTRRYVLLALFSSMLLHAFGDLPLHHGDEHRHFFPFIDWRFASPISYWDPEHHGRWASLVEFISVLAASSFMYWRLIPLRPWVAGAMVTYLLYWIYVYSVWL